MCSWRSAFDMWSFTAAATATFYRNVSFLRLLLRSSLRNDVSVPVHSLERIRSDFQFAIICSDAKRFCKLFDFFSLLFWPRETETHAHDFVHSLTLTQTTNKRRRLRQRIQFVHKVQWIASNQLIWTCAPFYRIHHTTRLGHNSNTRATAQHFECEYR